MAYTRPKLLQKVVRRDFKQRVSNEEHHKRNCVLIRGHLSLGQEVIVCVLVEDLCISYAQDENWLIKSWFHAYRC